MVCIGRIKDFHAFNMVGVEDSIRNFKLDDELSKETYYYEVDVGKVYHIISKSMFSSYTREEFANGGKEKEIEIRKVCSIYNLSYRIEEKPETLDRFSYKRNETVSCVRRVWRIIIPISLIKRLQRQPRPAATRMISENVCTSSERKKFESSSLFKEMVNCIVSYIEEMTNKVYYKSMRLYIYYDSYGISYKIEGLAGDEPKGGSLKYIDYGYGDISDVKILNTIVVAVSEKVHKHLLNKRWGENTCNVYMDYKDSSYGSRWGMEVVFKIEINFRNRNNTLKNKDIRDLFN